MWKQYMQLKLLICLDIALVLLSEYIALISCELTGNFISNCNMLNLMKSDQDRNEIV